MIFVKTLCNFNGHPPVPVRTKNFAASSTTYCNFNGHRYGGIRPYRPPVPVRTRNFEFRRRVTESLTGIGIGVPAHTAHPYQIQVCNPTRTDASNGAGHRYGWVCPVPSARTVSVASQNSWAGRVKPPNQPFFLSFLSFLSLTHKNSNPNPLELSILRRFRPFELGILHIITFLARSMCHLQQ
jgi:hypothetical protein